MVKMKYLWVIWIFNLIADAAKVPVNKISDNEAKIVYNL